MNCSLVDLNEHSIILFDGDCNFCNRSVQFIIQRDSKGCFRFASLQSSIAQSLLADHHSASRFDSIILIEKKQLFAESTAVLRICKEMDGLWKGLYALIIFPKPIRDAMYRLFAKHRYLFLGKQKSCITPTSEIRNRFLDIEKRKDDA